MSESQGAFLPSSQLRGTEGSEAQASPLLELRNLSASVWTGLPRSMYYWFLFLVTLLVYALVLVLDKNTNSGGKRRQH